MGFFNLSYAGSVSKYDTAGAASCIVVLEVLAPIRSTAADSATPHCGPTRGLFLVEPTDFTNEIAECLVYVDALLCRRLDEFAAKVLCQITTLIHADLALILQVALVRYNDHREGVLVLYAQNLLVISADLLERVPRSDRVHKEEAFACAHVLFPHGPIFLLAGCVEDIQKGHLIVDNALLPVRVFDGRVILVDKVLLNKLDRQGRLSDTSSSNNDQLVLSEKLRLGSSGHLCGWYKSM